MPRASNDSQTILGTDGIEAYLSFSVELLLMEHLSFEERKRVNEVF